MVDRAPGENAGRDVEDFVGGVGIEIGCGHGADAALAEAPRRGSIGLGDLLLHLHEGVERHLAATETLRQQRAISPFSISAAVTAGVRRRVRSISSASRAISGCSARARSTRSRPGDLFMRVLVLSGFVWRNRNGGPSAATNQDGWTIPSFHAVARPRSSEGSRGRFGDGKLNATATAAMPMPKEPT